jgi:hypothetical protein
VTTIFPLIFVEDPCVRNISTYKIKSGVLFRVFISQLVQLLEEKIRKEMKLGGREDQFFMNDGNTIQSIVLVFLLVIHQKSKALMLILMGMVRIRCQSSLYYQSVSYN